MVSVVDRFLVWPTFTTPKIKLVGLSVTTMPVPLSKTVCGLPGALSLIDNVPVRVPAFVGLKVTLIVQDAPGATELPHVLVWAKSPGSAPVNPTLMIPSVTVP